MSLNIDTTNTCRNIPNWLIKMKKSSEFGKKNARCNLIWTWSLILKRQTQLLTSSSYDILHRSFDLPTFDATLQLSAARTATVSPISNQHHNQHEPLCWAEFSVPTQKCRRAHIFQHEVFVAFSTNSTHRRTSESIHVFHMQHITHNVMWERALDRVTKGSPSLSCGAFVCVWLTNAQPLATATHFRWPWSALSAVDNPSRPRTWTRPHSRRPTIPVNWPRTVTIEHAHLPAVVISNYDVVALAMCVAHCTENTHKPFRRRFFCV